MSRVRPAAPKTQGTPWEGGLGAGGPLGSPAVAVADPASAPLEWRPTPVLATPVFAPAQGQAQAAAQAAQAITGQRRAIGDRTRGLLAGRAGGRSLLA